MNTDKVATGFTWVAEYFDPAGKLEWSETTHNLVPTEGLNHIAGAIFKGVTQVPTWYIAPYKGNYTPNAAETAATVVASAQEFVAYDEPARVAWNEGAVAFGALDNTANRAEFTINAPDNIYGGFMVSSSAKGATTGVLVSLIRFPSPKPVEAGGTLRITAGVAFTSI